MTKKARLIAIGGLIVGFALLLIWLVIALFFKREPHYSHISAVGVTRQSVIKNLGVVQYVFYKNKKPIATQWYNNGHRLIYKEGRIPDGIVTELYQNGRLKGEYIYIQEKREGSAKTFYPNHRIYKEEQFRNDEREGLSSIFDRYHRIILSENYRKGVLEGIQQIYDSKGSYIQVEYDQGKPSNQIRYFSKKGKLIAESTIKNKKLDGLCLIYYPNQSQSLKTVLTFKNDVLNGIVKTFYENGSLQAEYHCKDNQLDGEASKFNVSGNLVAIESYKNGILNGESRYFQDNRILTEIISFEDGLRHGNYQRFAPSGTLVYSTKYRKGILYER